MNTARARRAALALPFALTVALTSACQAASPGSAASTTAPAPDPQSATYQLDKTSVTLANGRAETPVAPGSAAKIITTLTDHRITGDVDGDGRSDSIVVLVSQPGGSGSFYYLAVLLNGASGVTVTPGAMLGDRINVQALRLDGRTIAVELLDHAAGQPMAASPTVAMTKRFAVDGGVLEAR